MTTQELFKKMLTDRGMFDSQADSVIEAFKAKIEADAAYQITWNRPSNEYPDALYAVMAISLFACAIEWIDANMPKAWFRGVFLLESQKA